MITVDMLSPSNRWDRGGAPRGGPVDTLVNLYYGYEDKPCGCLDIYLMVDPLPRAILTWEYLGEELRRQQLGAEQLGGNQW